MSVCRSCGADVVWTHTREGRRMPLDARPSPAGNVRLDTGDARFSRALVLAGGLLEAARAAGEALYTSHFATCPQARSWRRG